MVDGCKHCFTWTAEFCYFFEEVIVYLFIHLCSLYICVHFGSFRIACCYGFCGMDLKRIVLFSDAIISISRFSQAWAYRYSSRCSSRRSGPSPSRSTTSRSWRSYSRFSTPPANTVSSYCNLLRLIYLHVIYTCVSICTMKIPKFGIHFPCCTTF